MKIEKLYDISSLQINLIPQNYFSCFHGDGFKFYEIWNKMWNDYQKDLGLEQEPFLPNEYRDDYVIYFDNEIVGFVLIGTFPNALFEDDIFIQDIYIKPEKRRKGIATATIINILERKCYLDKEWLSLFILKNNEVGKEFWKNLTSKLGLTDRLTAVGITATTDKAEFHLFSPYKKNVMIVTAEKF